MLHQGPHPGIVWVYVQLGGPLRAIGAEACIQVWAIIAFPLRLDSAGGESANLIGA